MEDHELTSSDYNLSGDYHERREGAMDDRMHSHSLHAEFTESRGGHIRSTQARLRTDTRLIACSVPIGIRVNTIRSTNQVEGVRLAVGPARRSRKSPSQAQLQTVERSSPGKSLVGLKDGDHLELYSLFIVRTVHQALLHLPPCP